MFEAIPTAPPDAILGLTEEFHDDACEDKVNLGSGHYHDKQGNIPILACVIEAQRRLAAKAKTKAYLPIPGLAAYRKVVLELIFGTENLRNIRQRAAVAQTPGGSGALRVAADFLRTHCPGASVWVSEPTWPNHIGIFTAAGMAVKKYSYFDACTMQLDFNALIDSLRAMATGDIVVLQTCCHNPTGVDPTLEQWNLIQETIAARRLLPLIDFAYQGFGDSIEQDAQCVQAFCRSSDELLVCYSFSKNLGLYCERAGALCVVARSANDANAVQSQINTAIRSNYSNPPAHGAEVASLILQDVELRTRWIAEVDAMRHRIKKMRLAFVEALRGQGVFGKFDYVTQQRGMFSYLRLTPNQIEALKRRYGIYVIGSGRINVGGLTSSNVLHVAAAIAQVTRGSHPHVDVAPKELARPSSAATSTKLRQTVMDKI